MKIPSREETARFIEVQLGDHYEPDAVDLCPGKQCAHYGVYELRNLLDFIYGGEPSSDAEKIDAAKSLWHSGEHN